MNPFKIIKHQLYLLQLENYELGRFWKLLFRKGILPKENQRQELVWTVKARAFLIFSFLLILSFSGLCVWLVNGGQIKFWYLSLPAFVILAYLLSLVSFVFLGIVEILFLPIEFFAKALVILWAKEKLKKFPDLKIIAIAGSYGKTTMKQVLLEVLGVKFNVAATPSSINTPVGIARWIIRRFDSSLEIAIVEMGEHYCGDVKYLCKITPPDIAVVMGINEAHLERMKTLDNVENTIFEVVSFAKAGAEIYLNANDERVVKNFKKYVWPDHKLAFYGQRNNESGIKNYEFNPERLGWDVEVEDLEKVFINLLGEYAIKNADAAIKIAQSLGMTKEEIKKGIANIKPIEHRLEPIKGAGGVLVIDDSYNGNPSGASEAIKVLSRFSNRRKVYITPGLVETGKAAPEVHREIGKQLAQVADVVILIRNSVTGFIEMGIQSAPSRAQPRDLLNIENKEISRLDALARNGKTQIIWFNTALEAHAALATILKPGDVILFQNDWGDQYI
jgi:UDP-N-acetylmuramoyl-tripeptide--D-alanyl-D-alanine ligase